MKQSIHPCWSILFVLFTWTLFTARNRIVVCLLKRRKGKKEATSLSFFLTDTKSYTPRKKYTRAKKNNTHTRVDIVIVVVVVFFFLCHTHEKGCPFPEPEKNQHRATRHRASFFSLWKKPTFFSTRDHTKKKIRPFLLFFRFCEPLFFCVLRAFCVGKKIQRRRTKTCFCISLQPFLSAQSCINSKRFHRGRIPGSKARRSTTLNKKPTTPDNIYLMLGWPRLSLSPTKKWFLKQLEDHQN